MGRVDDPHAAVAEFGADRVRAEGGAWAEGHGEAGLYARIPRWSRRLDVLISTRRRGPNPRRPHVLNADRVRPRRPPHPGRSPVTGPVPFPTHGGVCCRIVPRQITGPLPAEDQSSWARPESREEPAPSQDAPQADLNPPDDGIPAR